MALVAKWIKHHTLATCIILFFILVVSAIACVGIGPVSIPFSTVWSLIFQKITGGQAENMQNYQNIVWFLRMPRVVLGIFVGSGLSIAGVAMQALTRNPLADPYILGISSGAYFGAVSAIILRIFSVFGAFQVQVGAFLGAMLAIGMVYILSRRNGTLAPTTLVLVGMAVSAMFGAFANFIVYSAPDDSKIRETTFWLLGGIAGVSWAELVPVVIVVIIAAVILFTMSRTLNALMMGEHTAITLGVSINAVHRVLIVLTALLTGILVSVSGCIGFVGLVVPHLVRAIVGADHRKVISLSALLGSIFLIWTDVVARMADIPKEIPIGILTSMIGAPLFLWMLRVQHYSFGEK